VPTTTEEVWNEIYDGDAIWQYVYMPQKAYYPVAASTTTVTTQIYPDTISIAGEPFTVNTSFEPYRREAFRHRTIMPQRQSINFENIAGYGTLNTEGLWRRDQLDWSEGAGQEFLDRKQTSSASRFRSSKGVNPWVENQLTLLNDTALRGTGSSNSNFKAISVGTSVFAIDGTSVIYYKSNWSSTRNVVSSSLGTLYDICTDGSLVYVGTSTGIWKIDSTVATPTAVKFVNVGAIANSTYQIDNLTGNSGHNIIHLDPSKGMFPDSVQVGMQVSSVTGTAVPAGTYITGVSTQSITINNALASTITTVALKFTVKFGFTIAAYTMVRICNGVLVAAVSQANEQSRGLLAFTTTPSTLGAVPDASNVLMIHENLNFKWTCAAGGMTQIYVGGYVNQYNTSTGAYKPTQGAVYRASMTGATAVSASTQPFDLNYPIQTMPFEVGEYPTALYSYLNFVFIGTNLGIRMCQTLSVYDPSANQTGDLKAGPLAPNLLQPVTAPVTAIVGNGRFIYFGWSNYNNDGVSTGIGRMDLTQTIGGDTLSLAYASDLMVSGQGLVNWLDWDPFTLSPLMSVTGKGIYSATSTYVASGTINSGWITYGITDNKIPVKLDMSANINSSVGIAPVVNMFDPTGININIQPNNYVGSEVNIDGGSRSERVNVSLTLFAANNNTATPTLYRYTLKCWPAAVSETMITPVISFYRSALSGAQVKYNDPYEKFWFLQELLQSQSIVEYAEGPLRANVIVEAMDWLPHKAQDNYEQGFVGDCVVTLKTIGGYSYVAAPTS
jgi:hypothetical protein